MNFNTLEILKILKEKGFSESQSEAILQILMEAITCERDYLVTQEYLKSEMTGLKSEMTGSQVKISADFDEFKTQIRKDFDDFKTQMRQDMHDFKIEMKHDMNEFKTEIRKDFDDFKIEMKHDMNEFKTEIRKDFDEFKTEMRQDMHDFKIEMKHDMHEFKTEVRKDIADFKLETNENFTKVNLAISKLSVEVRDLVTQSIKWSVKLHFAVLMGSVTLTLGVLYFLLKSGLLFHIINTAQAGGGPPPTLPILEILALNS